MHSAHLIYICELNVAMSAKRLCFESEAKGCLPVFTLVFLMRFSTKVICKILQAPSKFFFGYLTLSLTFNYLDSMTIKMLGFCAV